MKQDREKRFWIKNEMVGYIDEDDKLFGINPLSNSRQELRDYNEANPSETLSKWLKLFSN